MGGGSVLRAVVAGTVVAAGWGVLVAGCSSGDGSTGSGAAPTVVPAGDPVAGEALYGQYCASCHGADLEGTDRGPSHLSKVYEPGHHSDASFRSAIARGSPAHHFDFGDMPPVPGLDAQQVEDIIAYVRAEQQARGFQPYP